MIQLNQSIFFLNYEFFFGFEFIRGDLLRLAFRLSDEDIN
jgi:hypothetical protein